MASRRMTTQQVLGMPFDSSSGHDYETDSASEAEEKVQDSGSEFSVREESSDDEATLSADEVPVLEEDTDVQQPGAARLPVGRPELWVTPNMEQPALPAFTGLPGCRVKTENFLPISFFQLFMDDVFLEKIVEQTNLYAEQYLRDNRASLRPHSRATRWIPTNLEELKKFLGLTFLMGLIRKPSLSSYWSTSPLMTTAIFSATMSRNRYLLLLRMLHFVDNTLVLPRDHPDSDRLFKIRPILNHFVARFSEIYVPGKEIAVDESLLMFKGRLVFRHCVPSKRTRCGIKMYLLSESTTGYVYNFRVYTGRESSIDPPGCPSTFEVGEKIVWELGRQLFNKGHHLYLDNFYTGVQLLRELFKVNTVACGTIRSNREGYPRELVYKKLKREQCSALRNNELLAVKFADRRDVYMLTTIHDERTSPVTVQGQVAEVCTPACILDYNKHMGDVDRVDQRLEPYTAVRKAYVWYKKLGIHLFHLAMFNAFIVFKSCSPESKMTFVKFQESVIESLILVEQARVAREAVVEDVARLKDQHFPDHIPPTPKKYFPAKKCRVCARRGIRRETRMYCPMCPSKPGLCLASCFRSYHTQKNYWELR
ncbi:piggyBac transposable element-derived protein 4-like [Pleurodeles waltl]|uniref:piggyBac transposable element-derived protein 4-like n=1 Tax=Pleurodeles waltl TaxID=8319 RepID=UPI00370993B2